MAENPEPLVLDEDEQVALVGLLLLLWSRDLKETEEADRRRAREALRNKLRFERRRTEPDGKDDHAPLEIESPAVLKKRLAAVESEADGLQLLIAACASQPWATMDEPFRGKLDGDVRERTLGWAARALPGRMNAGTVRAIDAIIAPTFSQRAWRKIRRPKVLAAIGVGSLAAAATAGVAAPAIGAAIGGTMGLSGAAATSAGLATMGGGAVAAGGAGMAGGTAVIGALGAVGGAGIGGAIGSAKVKATFASQSLQLIALVNVGSELTKKTALRCQDQRRLVEIELGELVATRARTRGKRETEKLERGLAVLMAIREEMRPKFELG